MSGRTFLDTNILVYAYDTHEPQKQRRVQEPLQRGIEDESAVLSAQVLSEFFTVVTRRIPNPLSIQEAEDALNLVSILPVIEIDLMLVRRAIGIHSHYGITYWDSLIVAASERAECVQIFSKDLNPDQSYNGIVAVNPFGPSSESS